MKGLPSGYNRDFHEHKEFLVASLELIIKASDVIPPLISTTTLNTKRMEEISSANFANATELANYLVLKHKMPFRHAHDVVGTLVGKLSRNGKNFMTDFPTCVAHLHEHGVKATDAEIRSILNPKDVMMSYNVTGGTGNKAVLETMALLREELTNKRAVIAADRKRVDTARDNCRAMAAASSKVLTLADLKSLVKKFT
jgi:argininosuccinate lyase